jgi:rSAM/selenodomain-associated transferase 2
MERISIIIPVLNEEENIQVAIDSIFPSDNMEVIVVDGGSKDRTIEVVKELGVMLFHSRAGRANQMNLGAKNATGDILVFLHADTRLPTGFDDLIRTALGDVSQFRKADAPRTNKLPIAGAFALEIDDRSRRFRWVEWGVKYRSRFLKMPYGDQAIFLRAKVFDEIGGFPDLPIMEDFELMRRLQKLGSVAIIEQPVITSARRWLQQGIFKTTLINQLMILGYLMGVDLDRLVQLYRLNK